MGWSTIPEKLGDVWTDLTNQEGEVLYVGKEPSERSYEVFSEMDLHLRRVYDRSPTKEEWAHFLKFRTVDERSVLILQENPQHLPAWECIQEAYVHEDSVWMDAFGRGIDPVEWYHMYSPPRHFQNPWVELIMGIAVVNHQAVMSLPFDVLQDLRLLDLRRLRSGLTAALESGQAVELLTKTRDGSEVYVGIPSPTTEAEIEFRNLILEIFAP